MEFQNLAAFVLLLGALVFVHELGHFLFAKAVGVKVLRFSIGFGPPLLSFTRGETEYRIAALPLGGYVKMAGEVPGEDAAPEDEARSYLAQSPWKRMLIVAAGPAFNLIFPLLIFFVVIVSYPQPSTAVLRVVPGMPADVAGIRVGDVVTEVDGRPVRSLEEMQWALVGKAGQRVPVVVQRDGKLVKLVVTPSREGAIKNRGLIGIAPNRAPPVVAVRSGGPAERAGVQTLDRVLTVNGHPLGDLQGLERELSSATGPEITLPRCPASRAACRRSRRSVCRGARAPGRRRSGWSPRTCTRSSTWAGCSRGARRRTQASSEVTAWRRSTASSSGPASSSSGGSPS